MILKKEQINRYMRHIIMPEIGGKGQKKILESTVYVYGESVKHLSPLIYYLSASGIGSIFCYFENNDGYNDLFYNIRDFNNDVSIDLIDEQSLHNYKDTEHIESTEFTCNIFLGNLNLLKRIKNELIFFPTIISITNQWKGTLQTFDNIYDFNYFAESLSDKLSSFIPDSTFPENLSYIASSALGTLCSIEAVKLCLNIGERQKNPLYLDILSMEFNTAENNKIDLYLEKLSENNENTSYIDTVKQLSLCKVLVVGAGGLGSPAAFLLSMAGAGSIGLIDYDVVEISNLNRQILHTVSRIGMPKVESAKFFLKDINPDINIITHNTPLNADNVMDILKDYDVIISGVDNIPARYLINDACFSLKKPMIESGVLRFNGMNTTIIPEEGHCYRCIYTDNVGSGLSCAESGTLGPVPGFMGFIEAAEAIKLVSGKGDILKNKLLMFDALTLEINVFNIGKNPDCPLCGEK